jgi:hypothetical protein
MPVRALALAPTSMPVTHRIAPVRDLQYAARSMSASDISSHGIVSKY